MKAVRLLLVEDLQNLHVPLLELLNTVGNFQLVAAKTTEAEANLWLQEHAGEWDLALIDLVLNQGSGMGVIPRAKMTPGTHIAVFTSYATDGMRAHCMRLGADAVFQKDKQIEDMLLWCARLSKDGAQGDASPTATT